MKIRVCAWSGKKPMKAIAWAISSGRGRNFKNHAYFTSYDEAVAALAALTSSHAQ